MRRVMLTTGLWRIGDKTLSGLVLCSCSLLGPFDGHDQARRGMHAESDHRSQDTTFVTETG